MKRHAGSIFLIIALLVLAGIALPYGSGRVYADEMPDTDEVLCEKTENEDVSVSLTAGIATYSDHEYKYAPEFSKAPTCTEAGYDAFLCVSHYDYLCKYEVPATGHSFVRAGTEKSSDPQYEIVVMRCERCGQETRETVKVDRPAQDGSGQDSDKGSSSNEAPAGQKENNSVKENKESVTSEKSSDTKNGDMQEEPDDSKKKSVTKIDVVTKLKAISSDGERAKGPVTVINAGMTGILALEVATFFGMIFPDVRVIRWYRGKKAAKGRFQRRS